MNEAIRGLWCATLTPLGASGVADVACLADHAKRLFASGVEGVAPFGTTGEGPSFSPRERQRALDELIEAGVAASRILAPTTCPDLPDTIAMSRQAVAAGCAGCLVLPPFFFKGPSDAGLFAWYARLIEGVADDRLRVYLYNLPQVSAVPVTAGLAGRLRREFPRVVAGVKDSGGDFAHTTALIAAMPGASVMVGHEPHLPRLMRAGGAGTVCGVANLFPARVRALLRPDAPSDDERAIATLLDILFRFPLIPAMKSLRAWQTGDARWHTVRPPLVALDGSENAELRDSLTTAGFLAQDGAH